jgi:O-antigen/teichoic acid export membrane protein
VLLGATIKDGLVYLPSQALPSLLGLISVPIFTRIFTPDQYGQLAIVGSTVSFMLIGTAWGHESGMRFYAAAERDNNLPAFFGAAILSLLTTLVLIGVVGGLILSHLPAILPREYLGFAIVIFVAEALFKQGLQLLRVAQKSVAYTTLTVSFSVAKLALSLLLVFFWRREIASLLWAWALTDLVLVPFIAGRLSLPNHVRHAKWSSVKSYFEEFIAYGTPFVISSGAWATLSIVDRFVIQHFRGSAEVGLYYVGSVPNLGFSFIFTLLAFASYPIIVDTWEKAGSEPTQRLINGLLRLYFMLSVPLVVGVSILSKEIIGVLAAPQYLSAYKVVPLVALGGLFQGLLPFTTKSFVLLKRSGLNMAIGVAGAAFSVVLNLVLVPLLGYLGAGLTMALAHFVVVALTVVISEWLLGFKYRVSLFSITRISLASLFMAACVFSIGRWYPRPDSLEGLGSAVVIGIAAYAGALLSSKEVSVREVVGLIRTFGAGR